MSVSTPDVDLAPTEQILATCDGKAGSLIPVLQQVQEHYGYVPAETVPLVAQHLGLFEIEVFGVLTFYRQFFLEPRGRHILRVCQGTACHVMGAKDLFDYLRKRLKIDEGETTPDGAFSLERVACLGCCGMAPVLAADEVFHGECKVEEMDSLLDAVQDAEESL